MKCACCGHRSSNIEDFFSPHYNPQFFVCWNCCSDISVAIRTKVLNGNVDMIRNMINGLTLRLKAAEENA